MRLGATLTILVGLAAPAAADTNDLVLSRLAVRTTDSSGNVTSVAGDSVAFRSLASQLGVVLAPDILTPADTLGFSGFQLSVDYAYTTIDPNGPYWRALQGSPDPTGTGGSVVAPGSLGTVGFFVRKGMWLPVPSIEIGAGAVHLADSRMWTGQLYAKFALHEGYHDLPLPSLAVRAGVSRLLDQRQLDLTVVSLDAVVSKHFGIGGTWRFDPFAGWDVLIIDPHSELIEGTPNIDPLQPGTMDALNNFVFKDQTNILRQRAFIGAKLQYYVFQITLAAQFAFAGTSVDDVAGMNSACMPGVDGTTCQTHDTAKAQRTFTLSTGFDF